MRMEEDEQMEEGGIWRCGGLEKGDEMKENVEGDEDNGEKGG